MSDLGVENACISNMLKLVERLLKTFQNFHLFTIKVIDFSQQFATISTSSL